MIAPASAMSISSLMDVGNIANATFISPLFTLLSNSDKPRMPPMKSMRLFVRGSSIPRIGLRTWFCSSDTSNPSTGSSEQKFGLKFSLYHL